MDSFQQTLFKLKNYWSERGCIIQEPYDMEVGAGTMCPETFLRVVGPETYTAWRTCSPAGVPPMAVMAKTQTGCTSTSSSGDPETLARRRAGPVSGSLEAIGIDLRKHDIKFEEDNWESPTLGAWGIGWQVMLDGMEITQFTYFQQCGGVDLDLVPAEITYGLERLVAFLQGKESVYDIEWTPGVTYRDVRLADELQNSVYNFEVADVETLWQLFDITKRECQRLLDMYPSMCRRSASRCSAPTIRC